MKAIDLSRYFEVSVRTIYRDIDSLQRAGIPIVSLPGQEGGYELMDQFKWDKEYLTLEELLSIRWALESMEKATGLENINKLVSKINQLIEPTQDKSNQVQISHSKHSSQHIQTIYKSILNSHVMKIRYVDEKGKETEREIESKGIFLKDYHWYTWAYCLLRKELRIFKLTRIMDTYPTNRYFTRRPYTMKDIYDKEDSTIEPFTVCLQFNREMKAQVLDNFQEDEIVVNPDETFIVKKEYYTMDKAITHILRFGNKVRIIYPKKLINQVTKCLDDMKELYREQ